MQLAFNRSSTETVDSAENEQLDASKDSFGTYRLLQVLGEGGMGIVYLAEQQTPVRRRVALKVIKLGMDSKDIIGRFESERQVLAIMDHPNIARVFDAGISAKGRPYFVMEYVPGIPITDYCDQNKLRVRERLDLFCHVCLAVQHAHQRGVIHRDLKPANILVEVLDGKPVPKVIDFGVAKATSQHLCERSVFTARGVLIGTPEYMSPEQAGLTELDVDTTTDIYTLGVVLYELLVGALPFGAEQLRRAGYAEMCRIIRETDPPRLTTKLDVPGESGIRVALSRGTDLRALLRQVRGDLEWITMKALEKNRARRYASASELAQDIARHLNDEPVSACPPSAGYRFNKFIRKHRGAVTTLVAVILTLLVGLAVSSGLYFRAERQRLEAMRQSYVANIHAAELHLENADVGSAKQVLLRCNERQRGWEWKYLWRKIDSSVATLYPRGRSQFPPGYSSFAFSPDKTKLYWSSDFSVDVWDASSYDLITTYRGFGQILSMTSTGTRILAQRAHLIELVDPAKHDVLATLSVDGLNVAVASLSPDGTRAVTGSRDGTIQLWDLPSGRELSRTHRKDEIEDLVFASDGRKFASITKESGQIHSTATGEVVTRLEDSSGLSLFPVFSSDDSRIAAASEGKSSVWDTTSGRIVLRLGNDQEVEALAFNKDGTQIVTATIDGKVRIWSAYTGQVIDILNGFQMLNGASSAAFSPDAKRLFVGNGYGPIRVWDSADYIGLGEVPSEQLSSSAVSTDGSKGARAIGNKVIVESLAAIGRKTISSWDGDVRIVKLAFAPEGNVLAVGDEHGGLSLHNSVSGNRLQKLRSHASRITAMGFDAAGTLFVSASQDGTIRVWDQASQAMVAAITLQDRVNSVAFSPDRRKILIGSGDVSSFRHFVPELHVWEWDRNAKPVPLVDATSLGYAVTSAVFSPDGRKIAAASQGVTIWDTRSQQVVTRLSNSHDAVVAFSPDGTRLATRNGQGTIRIWDTTNYDLLLTLSAPYSGTLAFSFSSDGALLCYASRYQTLCWDSRSKYEAGADTLVERIRNQYPLLTDTIKQIQSDTTLDPRLRSAALRLAALQGNNVSKLEEGAADTVTSPSRSLSDYQKAMHVLEAKAQMEPANPNSLLMLAAAQYRCGLFREALLILAKVDDLLEQYGIHSAMKPILLSMTYMRLGETEKARSEIRTARDVIQARHEFASNRTVHDLLTEAELLILGGSTARRQ